MIDKKTSMRIYPYPLKEDGKPDYDKPVIVKDDRKRFNSGDGTDHAYDYYRDYPSVEFCNDSPFPPKHQYNHTGMIMLDLGSNIRMACTPAYIAKLLRCLTEFNINILNKTVTEVLKQDELSYNLRNEIDKNNSDTRNKA